MTAAASSFSRKRAKKHDGTQEIASAADRLPDHCVKYDLFESDHVSVRCHGGGGLADAGAANGVVHAVFCVGIRWIVDEADGTCRRTRMGLVLVGEVHEVVLERGVVVGEQSAGAGVAEEDFYWGNGEAAPVARKGLWSDA